MENKINFHLKSSARAKYLRIAVYPNGSVVVTKPARTPIISATDFVQRKSPWIRRKLDFYKDRKIISLAQPNQSLQEALEFVSSRIEIYNRHYKFEVNKIRVKNHKGLWGSCSSRKNLNFNYKIISLALHQADYIIVHELCHLKQFNHSRAFWDLVAETIPHYSLIKQELKNYSFY